MQTPRTLNPKPPEGTNRSNRQEGTGEAKKDRGIDPHAYEKGKWYRFLNYKGDCYVLLRQNTNWFFLD